MSQETENWEAIEGVLKELAPLMRHYQRIQGSGLDVEYRVEKMLEAETRTLKLAIRDSARAIQALDSELFALCKQLKELPPVESRKYQDNWEKYSAIALGCKSGIEKLREKLLSAGMQRKELEEELARKREEVVQHRRFCNMVDGISYLLEFSRLNGASDQEESELGSLYDVEERMLALLKELKVRLLETSRTYAMNMHLREITRIDNISWFLTAAPSPIC